MGNILRFFGGVLLTAFIVIVTLARLAVEMIGASTTPDDFALLKQRMPAVLSWLFSTPWWVPTMLLFGASAAAAWLIWTGTKRAAAHEMVEHDALDDQAISTLIDARLSEFLATTLRDEFTTHAQSHAFDEKLVGLSEKAKSAQGSALIALDHGKSEIDRIEIRISDLAKRQEQLVSFVEQRTGELSERFANVDAALAAILNREWHERLFRELGAEYERLAAPVQGGLGILDGVGWLKSVKSWQAKFHQWLGIADYYAMGAEQKIRPVPDFVYEREWSFDEKPLTAAQVHRYKEMATKWQSAQDEKPRIDKCFEMAAFHSPSRKGRPDSPPRPGEDR